MSIEDNIPPGFMLRCTLRGHMSPIIQIAWSPNGRMLASLSNDQKIHLWDTETGEILRTFSEPIVDTGHMVRHMAPNVVQLSLFHRVQMEYIGEAYNMVWSPDGQILACSFSNRIRLWDTQTGRRVRTFRENPWEISGRPWLPSGQVLASSSSGRIHLWDTQTGQHRRMQGDDSWGVTGMAWSPDGRILACSSTSRIHLWDTQTGQYRQMLRGHTDVVTSLAWSPSGQMLASGSADQAIYLWDARTGRHMHAFEGHTADVNSVSFSSDGRFLASKSGDGTVRLWRVDTLEMVVILEEPDSRYWPAGLAFHPKGPTLSTLGEGDIVIRIWDLDVGTLLTTPPATRSVHYTNAKVVLVGDSGVGKSGLGLVLTRQPFVPTESTHGRKVWTFNNRQIELGEGRKETLLWDLAGQPGYRLIHQLHLNEVALALVVFDAHSETDPFAGIYHWVRALRMSERIQGNSTMPMKKLLVAARIDRGGKSVSRERIKALVQELGFDGYFETSAKEGWGISELTERIKKAIDWKILPKVTSTGLFQRIKEFLVAEKEAGHLLSTSDDLYRTFLKSEKSLSESKYLSAQFGTCIGRVESRDLIRRLSFGNLVLLQPELLDGYASALVNAVRDEPDGLGSISEEKVRAGNFPIPKGERIANREQEKLLLIAMIEDLLRYELALREQGEDGSYLIFPSQSTRENPDLPDAEGKAIVFRFEGPIQNIYATLAVRLSHSGLFTKKDLWKNAVTYTTKLGGIYGMFLHNIGEGLAELVLFFDKVAKEETRFHFEEYVRIHLERWALPNTIQRRRIFICSECGTPLDDLTVTRRRERGFDTIRCGVCETIVSLVDREERLTAEPTSLVAEMDQVADSKRDSSAAASTLQGKIATSDFDVFLCHNNKDKLKVKEIGEKLKELGILPWLDEWELRPGLPWQALLEKQIGQIKSAAVFVGKDGIGPWENMELAAFLRQFVKRSVPVIPVILPGAPKEPKLPIFLEGMTWVDFRQQEPDPMERLIWGITGERARIL